MFAGGGEGRGGGRDVDVVIRTGSERGRAKKKYKAGDNERRKIAIGMDSGRKSKGAGK